MDGTGKKATNEFTERQQNNCKKTQREWKRFCFWLQRTHCWTHSHSPSALPQGCEDEKNSNLSQYSSRAQNDSLKHSFFFFFKGWISYSCKLTCLEMLQLLESTLYLLADRRGQRHQSVLIAEGRAGTWTLESLGLTAFVNQFVSKHHDRLFVSTRWCNLIQIPNSGSCQTLHMNFSHDSACGLKPIS